MINTYQIQSYAVHLSGSLKNRHISVNALLITVDIWILRSFVRVAIIIGFKNEFMNRVNNKKRWNSSDYIEIGSSNWMFPNVYVSNERLKEATISNKVGIAICWRLLVQMLVSLPCVVPVALMPDSTAMLTCLLNLQNVRAQNISPTIVSISRLKQDSSTNVTYYRSNYWPSFTWSVKIW